MKAGTKVILAGLNADGMNGLHATAMKLDKDGERYIIKLSESGKSVKIKTQNLIVEKHDEEIGDEEDPFDRMLSCNGCCYCGVHRLEICKECGVDHRTTNRMYALDSDGLFASSKGVYEQAQKIVDMETKGGWSPARAPKKGEPMAQRLPIMTAIKLSKSSLAPASLNPGSLPVWVPARDGSLEDFAITLLSRRELAGNWDESDVNARVRLTIIRICKFMDEIPVGHNTSKYIITVQTEEMTEGVMSIIHATHKATDGKPIFTIEYKYYAPGEEPAQSVGRLLKNSKSKEGEGFGAQQWKIPAEGVRLFNDLLTQNSERLDPEYVKSFVLTTGYKLSVLLPVTDDFSKSTVPCKRCGKAYAKSVCSKCLVVRYCSRECQTADWAKHKRQCKPMPQERSSSATGSSASNLVKVDLAESKSNPNNLTDDYVYASSSIKTGKITTSDIGKFTAPKGGALFVIKIQRPRGNAPNPANSNPVEMLMVYDEKRGFNITIHIMNCSASDYNRLWFAIRDHGLSPPGETGGGGLKGYFRASVVDGMLLIDPDVQLPLQPW
jgi:hypothetical protein